MGHTFLLLVFALTHAPPVFSQDPGIRIESFAWLAGCWEGRYGNSRIVSEVWMKPLGKTMIGISRTVMGGKTIEHEFIRLQESDDGSVHYIANPSGQKETSFKLEKLEGTTAVFENPEHDYPGRIVYRLISADSLVARIEGTVNGHERASDFPFRRVRCE